MSSPPNPSATSPTSTASTARRASGPGRWSRAWPRELVTGSPRLHRARDPPRGGPLHGGQGRGHAGGAVLALLPAHDRAQEGGGDRVRDRRAAPWGLREDQRDEPGREAARGGARPRVPRPAGVEADRGDSGRPGGEPRAGVRAAGGVLRGDRAAASDPPGGNVREGVSGEDRAQARRQARGG